MILTEEMVLNLLKSQNYIQVPFPIEPEILEQAVNAFFKFLEEPAEVKDHIDFSIAPQHRRGDVGYKHRDAGDHIYNDSKDFFHFHPAILKRYEDFLANNPVVADFMFKAKPIWDFVSQTVFNILSVLDKEFAGTTKKVFATENVHILLRFLKYDWQESGKYLAKPHFDAGSFTLAVTESCPGLRIGSCPEDLTLVEHSEGNAIFMFSSNFKQVINSDEFSPGWHDVIQLDEAYIGKPFARWAIVAFIDAHGVTALPRSETHKWYVANP
ncbi:hypothetical protein BN59_03434 [Legionella massiliensis]|uniref:Fe2OG dioxygenase domain-containing protein n=1 Tax=Legionella massiliensis TaxID=1034943 RepID=A0A078L1J1_9GAMM|nr:hypothetical protein [Legionella massiliensis]CDZ79117.1 hypothetical protein BN59_03434 [Legionella massiliensis]CEE14855.1 hypothetical protein BN1094_03434 [Legionella massiliensis]